MLFCIRLPNFVQIGAPIADIWRHIHFSMAAATAIYYFRFRICWCHCLQQVKVYQHTKYCRHNSIVGWDITTSVFEKQTSAILEICTLFCIRLPNFVQIETSTAEIWRHIHFSRWRPRRLNTTSRSGFVSVDVTAFRRPKSISKPNFGEIPPLAAEI